VGHKKAAMISRKPKIIIASTPPLHILTPERRIIRHPALTLDTGSTRSSKALWRSCMVACSGCFGNNACRQASARNRSQLSADPHLMLSLPPSPPLHTYTQSREMYKPVLLFLAAAVTGTQAFFAVSPAAQVRFTRGEGGRERGGEGGREEKRSRSTQHHIDIDENKARQSK